ncbi:hypothetical protein Psyaliredsea_20000 [Psychrobacter alimentarius]
MIHHDLAKNAYWCCDGIGDSIICTNPLFYLAALAPLFPTFALISHFIVGTERSQADLKVALIFSILGVIPHLVYTLVVFVGINYISLYKALMLGVVAWIIAAAILVLTWQYIQS